MSGGQINNTMGENGIRGLRISGLLGASVLWCVLVWSLLTGQPPNPVQWQGVEHFIATFDLAVPRTWWLMGMLLFLCVPICRNAGLVWDAHVHRQRRTLAFALLGLVMMGLLMALML